MATSLQDEQSLIKTPFTVNCLANDNGDVVVNYKNQQLIAYGEDRIFVAIGNRVLMSPPSLDFAESNTMVSKRFFEVGGGAITHIAISQHWRYLLICRDTMLGVYKLSFIVNQLRNLKKPLSKDKAIFVQRIYPFAVAAVSGAKLLKVNPHTARRFVVLDNDGDIYSALLTAEEGSNRVRMVYESARLYNHVNSFEYMDNGNILVSFNSGDVKLVSEDFERLLLDITPPTGRLMKSVVRLENVGADKTLVVFNGDGQSANNPMDVLHLAQDHTYSWCKVKGSTGEGRSDFVMTKVAGSSGQVFFSWVDDDPVLMNTYGFEPEMIMNCKRIEPIFLSPNVKPVCMMSVCGKNVERAFVLILGTDFKIYCYAVTNQQACDQLVLQQQTQIQIMQEEMETVENKQSVMDQQIRTGQTILAEMTLSNTSDINELKREIAQLIEMSKLMSGQYAQICAAYNNLLKENQELMLQNNQFKAKENLDRQHREMNLIQSIIKAEPE